jgi:hypothetical protein
MLKLFRVNEDEARMKALAEALLEEKLARILHYKVEIQAWEEKKDRILEELRKRRQELREMIAQQQGIDDLVKKRHMTKVLLTQWRETDDAILRHQTEIGNVIHKLISNFKHELSLVAPYMTWAKREDKEKLINGYVVVVIEDLIDIYHRISEDYLKADIQKDICEIIDTAEAIDHKMMQSCSKIIKFRQDIYHVRRGIRRIFYSARSM